MQWIFVLLSMAAIGHWAYPSIKVMTETALLNAHLSIWNVGNWLGESVASTMTLLLFYADISAVKALCNARGKAARTQVLEAALRWALYGGLAMLSVYLTYQMAIALTNPTFAFLSAAVCLLVSIWILSLVESPDFEYSRVIQGVRATASRHPRSPRRKQNLSIIWGNDTVPPEQETRHFLTLGNIGSGKSTLMRMNLSPLFARINLQADCRGVVYDPKNELIPVIQAIGTPVWIMNPLDKRSVGWDLCADIVNPAQAQELANILVPDGKANDQHWQNSARLLIVGIVRVFIDRYHRTGRRWDLRDVINATEGVETLGTILAQIPENHSLLEYLKAGAGDRNDYIITLQTNLQPYAVIASLQHEATEKISLNAFLRSEVVLHLGADNEMSQVLVGWYGLILKRLTDLHLSLEPSRTRRTFWFFDEATDGARYFGDPLVRLLTLGRGFGCSVSIFIQNHSAMVEKFGPQQASAITALCRWKAIVGGVDLETANWIAKDVIGDNVQVVATTTQTQKAPSEQFRSTSDRTEKAITNTTQHRPTISPQALLDHVVPPTGPKTGLTGLFIGSTTGIHWHTYTWEEVQNRQVQVDSETLSRDGYQRINDDSPLYNLERWKEQERQALGLDPNESKEPHYHG